MRPLIPIGLLELRARLERRKEIWRGVYASTAEVPIAGEGFSGNVRMQRAREWTAKLLVAHEQRSGMPSDPNAIGEHRSLFAAAALIAAGSRRVNVLDYGGGLGDAFVYLRDALPAGTALDYQVVELPRVCAVGRELFARYPEVRFHAEFPNGNAPDIMYAAGSLQYIPDYRTAFEQLTSHRTRVVLLVDLPAGPGETFATTQANAWGSIPAWIFNRNEVVDLVQTKGYRLAFEERRIVPFSQNALPPERRIEDLHTLLFVATD